MTIIQTYRGKTFNLAMPDPATIDPYDIAHALSNLCRFTGHCHTFYSVAQHSVMVSHLVPVKHAFAGLMHDAAEAYIGDVSSPLKAMLPDYRLIEQRIEWAVRERFKLPNNLDVHDDIVRADRQALAAEKRDLMGGEPWPFLEGVSVPMARVVPMNPTQAFHCFMRRYRALSDEPSTLTIIRG